jgi:hypothetical protein
MSPRITNSKPTITRDTQGRMHIAEGLGPQSSPVILKAVNPAQRAHTRASVLAQQIASF